MLIVILKDQFLYKNTNSIKRSNDFYKLQKQCIFIVKAVKNTQVTRFQKIDPDFKE